LKAVKTFLSRSRPRLWVSRPRPRLYYLLLSVCISEGSSTMIDQDQDSGCQDQDQDFGLEDCITGSQQHHKLCKRNFRFARFTEKVVTGNFSRKKRVQKLTKKRKMSCFWTKKTLKRKNVCIGLVSQAMHLITLCFSYPKRSLRHRIHSFLRRTDAS